MKNRRRGFTLFEMLVALTLGTAALGTIVTTMQVLLRIDRSGRDRVAEASSMMRLGSLLRADAHASTRLVRAEKGMDLHGPDGLVARYRLKDAGMERTAEGADGKVASRAWHRLPPKSKTDLDSMDVDGIKLLVLTVSKDGGPGNVASRVERIEAALGRDLRYIQIREAR
jgi:prepilin-type N-terminal cleavage/methylation domain-containing protein